MPTDHAPAVTGSLWQGDAARHLISEWRAVPGTGEEYGGAYVRLLVHVATLWGLPIYDHDDAAHVAIESHDPSLATVAAHLARAIPAVQVDRPTVPELSGDLLEDARLVTGLTIDEIGRAARVSGRAVASWRAGTVPRHRQPFLQALRSIGLSLVGGLGAAGVRRWFLTGSPTRLDRLASGDIQGVASEARQYETSPAT